MNFVSLYIYIYIYIYIERERERDDDDDDCYILTVASCLYYLNYNLNITNSTSEKYV